MWGGALPLYLRAHCALRYKVLDFRRAKVCGDRGQRPAGKEDAMASANVMKLRGGAAAAILAHDHRHDGRDVEYENTHVNKTLSDRNSVRYWRGVHDPEMTAQGEYKRLQDRVAEIDKKEPPKRIRKDRVTMVGFEVPVPEGLPPEQEGRFFSIAYKEFAKMCGGAQNVSTLRIHRDEVHDYIDPATKDVKTSRVHAHCVGIPYVPGRGVNCKAWMTRQALRDLQKRIDDRCRQELGIAFMDGSRQRSRGTVEDLKRLSAQAVTAQKARIAELDAQAVKSTQAAEKAAKEAQEALDTLVWAQSATEDAERLKYQLDRIADQVDHARRRAALQGDLAAWLSRKHPEVVEEYDRYVDRTASMVKKTRRDLDDLER